MKLKALVLVLPLAASLIIGCKKTTDTPTATTETVVDISSAFTDANFLSYVLANYDANGDGKITSSEISNVTTLDIRSKSIASLAGIENFTALTLLNCSYNNLTTMDISKNTALTYLECYDDDLTTLNVSKNTALTDLECGFNQLTALDVSKNTDLVYLDCEFSLLTTTLDVSQNKALRELYCNNNPFLTTIYVWFPPSAVPGVDIFKDATATLVQKI